MASLRGRLLVALLVLTAVGMLALGGITYFGQRSFQFDRLDDQIRGAPPAAAHALGGDEPPGPGPGGEHGEPRGDGPGSGLPPGTYVERRAPDGTVQASQVFTYGQQMTAEPALPRDLPVDRPFTVGGRDGDTTSYRVYAQPDRFGGRIAVAAPLREVDASLDRLLLQEALVIAGALLVLGLVAWAVVRVGLLPLDRMGHTAGAIAGGDLSHRVEPTDPRTEVGRLGIALNAMLDRLEGAFAQRRATEERLRQFLADASHEVRTPLASIRGYAELFRMGASREPAEVENAMRRIEDEAARMGVLVEDLLMLARLDQVAEAPHTSVDLARLATDAVDDARATARDRDIALRAVRPATVRGDAHQLRQLLANLLRNALVHTPSGTPVEVSVTADGPPTRPGAGRRGEDLDGVRLEVRDHGPGLPTDDPAELFERFWRAEGGRERGRAGAGLGLAIVSAIVDAHGGRVSAANAPGGGAVFSVVLPGA